jgi:hypothetical protein
MKGCFSVIVFFIILIIIGFKLYEKWENAEKNPFWKGMELVQVCKKPYYSSDECYKLNVSLLPNKSAKINFNNGGYIFVFRLNCWFSGAINTPRYTFCRSYDNDGNQWDFLPSWVNY